MPNQQQTGFTLLETLVALFILSIGLVGLAHLHFQVIQQSQTTYQQTQALLFAQTISEQYRASPSFSLADWQPIIGQRLPAGEATLCIDSTPLDGTHATMAACDQQGPYHTVKIWWDHDRNPTTAKQRIHLLFSL